MRVLFVLRHAGLARNFESTLRLLAERGHHVHVSFDAPFAHARPEAGPGIVERLAAEHPRLTHGPAARGERDPWFALGTRLRAAVDFLRYLEPGYADARKLRARAERRVGVILRHLGRVAARRPGGAERLARALRRIERSLPVARPVARFVADRRPDVLALSPLVELGAPQTDHLRAAGGLGVPSALCVASWDNLTNKGLIAEVPDLVAVWNDAQAREAVALHGVPAERVVATGAPTYDQWFEWGPSGDRAAFAERTGLPAEGPIVLYLCSSEFIAPEEAAFVRRWLAALRDRPEPELRDAAVLVRPHPQNAAQWSGADLADHGPAVVWPPEGADPVDGSSRRDYYDSLFHCSAVVGVNTSALIESAIVGRPVLTYLAPEFRATQGGTPHFAHLVDGGPLRVAASFGEHAGQLAAALRGRAEGEDDAHAHAYADGDRARAFVRDFVRPNGLDRAATPILVDALEGLAGTRAVPLASPRGAAVVRILAAPIAGLAGLDAAGRRATRAAIRGALQGPRLRAAARRALAARIVRRGLGALAAPVLLEVEAALDGQAPTGRWPG